MFLRAGAVPGQRKGSHVYVWLIMVLLVLEVLFIGFDTDEEAVRIANDSRYGLNGGVETADAAKGYEMALQIRSGSVMLNGGTGRMSYAPIGGYKRSGVGREYGPDWLHEYQNQKSIFYPVGI